MEYDIVWSSSTGRSLALSSSSGGSVMRCFGEMCCIQCRNLIFDGDELVVGYVIFCCTKRVYVNLFGTNQNLLSKRKEDRSKSINQSKITTSSMQAHAQLTDSHTHTCAARTTTVVPTPTHTKTKISKRNFDAGPAA